MKRIWYVLIILVAGSACKEVYEDPPQALVEASLLNAETDKPLSSTISIRGIGQENVWLKDTFLSGFIVPLSMNDTTSYLISFDAQVDTLTFIHETFQKYDSMETGFYYEFKIISVESSHRRIDSIVLLDSLVTKNWHENIKLYLRPLPAGSN